MSLKNFINVALKSNKHPNEFLFSEKSTIFFVKLPKYQIFQMKVLKNDRLSQIEFKYTYWPFQYFMKDTRKLF